MQGTSSRLRYYRIDGARAHARRCGDGDLRFLAKRDVWKGVGLGVASLSLPLAVIDTFNNARAQAYRRAVGRFEPAVAASVSGIELSLTGQF